MKLNLIMESVAPMKLNVDYFWKIFKDGDLKNVKKVGDKIYSFIQSSDKKIELTKDESDILYEFLMREAKIDKINRIYFDSIVSYISANGILKLKK
jgi:nitrate reductase beta subunit